MEYHSNSELVEAIEILKKDLASSGHEEASALIEEGLPGLNGLTDGWAYLLEHIDLTNQKYGSVLNSKQSANLSEIQKVVHKVVHRA